MELLSINQTNNVFDNSAYSLHTSISPTAPAAMQGNSSLFFGTNTENHHKVLLRTNPLVPPSSNHTSHSSGDISEVSNHYKMAAFTTR